MSTPVPADVQTVDVGAAAADISPAVLAQLDDPKQDIPELADALEANFGGRPQLRIDLTDPPSLPVAIFNGIEASAADPDAAVRALAANVADVVRAAQAQATKVG